ncbi:MAG: glycosyltransferase family 39 protein [bacterium]
MICLVIFLAAIGVRLFHWQDNRAVLPKLFTGMVEIHKSNALLLAKGDIATFITGPAPPGDANILSYPPGYPIIMAIIFKVFGESDSSMRLFQIICDAGAAVLLFFIAAELLPVKVAAIAGLLAALSPQLAYYSLILIPDSLATLPILLAIYFIIRAKKSNSFRAVVAAGALVGISCWLRSNALMLTPFLAVLLLVIMERGPRLRYAAALVAAGILVIAPITIRNLVVFHHFIPLSLGVGQMLNVGIGDYDKERRFGLPGTDIETVTSEAEKYYRPEYARSLFGGNGIEREQQRTARALAVVRAHPVWFSGVVLRRAASMLRLERVHRIETTPGVNSNLAVAETSQPVWARASADLVGPGLSVQTQTNISLSMDGQALVVDSDAPNLGYQIVSLPIAVEKNTDYLLRVPVNVEQGNVVIQVMNADQTQRYGSTPVLSPLERLKPYEQSLDMHQIAFVSRNTQQIFLRLDNAGRRGGKTAVRLGRLELFRLGPASFLWTSYIRAVVHTAQLFFISAWTLPLALMGIALALLAGRRDVILILLAVPAYYLCFQSFLHTEYRYVLAAQSFLYVMAGITLYLAGLGIARVLLRK